MKIKRLFAYILDIIIITMISSLIFSMFDSARVAYQQTSQELLDFFQTSGSAQIDMDVLNDLLYRNAYDSRILTIIEMAVTVLYFGVIQFIANGQTLGKYLLKIRVKAVDDKTLNPGLFILRTIVLHNVLFNLISVIGLIIILVLKKRKPKTKDEEFYNF